MLGWPLAEHTARLEFAHPILRAAVIAGLGPAERALWHARAAQSCGPRTPIRSGSPCSCSRRTARAIPTRYARCAPPLAPRPPAAPRERRAYLRRALAEPPEPAERPAVLLELGLALAAHRHPDSPALLREAVESIADPAARGPAAVRATRALGLAALYADVVAICRATLAEPAGLPPDDVARWRPSWSASR
jgi:hypothetical protein